MNESGIAFFAFGSVVFMVVLFREGARQGLFRLWSAALRNSVAVFENVADVG
jgi:hypothetical protein